jgi:Zn-dependent peptidase ImmA (M78 family)
MSELDKDVVEALKRSKEILGEFYPVIIDEETGEPISGRHRKQAGWTSIEKFPREKKEEIAKKLNVSVEVVPLILRIHANVQRNISQEERKQEVNQLAEFLLKSGVPKELISKKLQELLPFSKKYILRLLSDEYKLEKKRKPVEQKPKEEVKVEEPKKEEPKPQEVKVEEKPQEEKKPAEELKPQPLDLGVKPPLNLPSNRDDVEFLIKNYDSIFDTLEIISCPVCGNHETAGWLCHNISFKEVKHMLEEKIKTFTAPAPIDQPQAKPVVKAITQKYTIKVGDKEVVVGEAIIGEDYTVIFNSDFEYEGKLYMLKIDQFLLKRFFIDQVITGMKALSRRIDYEVETDYDGTMVTKITVKGFNTLNNTERNSIIGALRYVVKSSVAKQIGVSSFIVK